MKTPKFVKLESNLIHYFKIIRTTTDKAQIDQKSEVMRKEYREYKVATAAGQFEVHRTIWTTITSCTTQVPPHSVKAR